MLHYNGRSWGGRYGIDRLPDRCQSAKTRSDSSLTALADKLSPHFLRVSRGEIINKDLVKEANRLFSGKFLIKLHDKAQTEITTGSSDAETVRSWLGW